MRTTRGTTDIHRHGALAAAALATLLLAGCTGGSADPDAATPAPDAAASTSPSAAATEPVDPLVALTTPGTSEFIAEDLQPAAHESGTGPTSFQVPQPESGVGSLQFFVTCTSGEYRVLMGGIYGSGCSPTGANSASIPIPQREAPLTVTVEVPDGVAFRIVALPV